MSNTANRMPLIDALKAIASQLIVLHHLAAYGPLSNAVQQAAPWLVGWFYDYARMAVQVFLVIGGFLAARGLAAQGDGLATAPFGLIWKRYTRLVIPFMAAMALAVVGAAIADLLGHSPEMLMNTYAHALPNNQVAVVERLRRQL